MIRTRLSFYTTCDSGGAAVPAEFLRQRGIVRIRMESCKRRYKRCTIVFLPTQSFIGSSLLPNATGVEQNGLQGTTAGTTLKH